MRLYRDGPLNDSLRSSTDKLSYSLLVLLAVVAFCLGVSTLHRGSISSIDVPFDSDHNSCGVKHADHPYIYFASPHPETLWMTVCVSKCPRSTDTLINCKPNSIVKSCSRQSLLGTSTSRLELYDSQPAAHHLCLPTSPHLRETIAPGIVSSGLEIKVKQLLGIWPLLLLSVAICLIFGLLVIYFMRECSGCFVWALIILGLLGLFAVGALLLYPHPLFRLPHGNQSQPYFRHPTFEKALGFISVGLATFLLLAVGTQYSRINLAVRIVECASRFISGQFTLLMLPLLLFAVYLVFAIGLFVLILGICSMSEPILGIKNPTLPYQYMALAMPHQILLLLCAVLLIWFMVFLVDSSSFLVSGTAVNWYFKQDSPFLRSRIRFVTYHTGSVAIGALLGLLFGPLKLLADILSPDPREVNSLVSKCKNYLCCLCASSIFTCYNSGAYSWMQITAQSYCNSAAAVSSLIRRNPSSSAVVPLTLKLFYFLGRLFATMATCFACYALLVATDSFRETVSSPLAPLLAVGVMSFVGSSLFLSLYADSAEGIYISYLLEADLGGDWNCPSELKWVLTAINRPHLSVML